MSFCVCSLTTSNGTCARPSRRCYLTRSSHASRAKMSLARRNHPRVRPAKPEPRRRSTEPRFTLFRPYWPIFQPSFAIPSHQILRALLLGNRKQNPQLFSKGRLICSKTSQPRSQQRELGFRPESFIYAGLRSVTRSKFGLVGTTL